MIKINTCQITLDGAYIELNIGSTLTSSIFTKLELYSVDTFGCKNKAIDFSDLYRKTNNKEALMIPLNDLGLNPMDIYFVSIENNEDESTIAVAGNLTDIVINNLNALQNLSLDKDCKVSSGCGNSELDNVLYAYTSINSLADVLNAKKYELAQSIVFSLKNSVVTKCDKSLDIFSIFTEDDVVKYKL